MQTKLKNIFKRKVYWLSVAIVGIILGLTLQFARAQVNPSSPAPAGSFGAPLTTTESAQRKIGDLTIGSTLSAEKKLCLGSKCITDFSELGSSTAGYQPGTRTFNTPGLTTFIVPAGVTKLKVQAWGGGGAGAIGFESDVLNGGWPVGVILTGGGGGASGGYVYTDNLPVTPGQKVWVQVGEAGKAVQDDSDQAYKTRVWAATRKLGGNGGDTTIAVTDAATNILDASAIKITAGGGYGGSNWDEQLIEGRTQARWIWWLWYDRGYYQFKSWMTQVNDCIGYTASGGVSRSSVAGAKILNGNPGTSCTNTNDNGIPGGSAIVDAAVNTLTYGAGGAGKSYGTPDYWTCNYQPNCSPLGDGMGEVCNAYTNFTSPANLTVYDPGYSCVKIENGTHNTKGNDGSAGAAVISW